MAGHKAVARGEDREEQRAHHTKLKVIRAFIPRWNSKRRTHLLRAELSQ
jgi:hypothetical protein